MATSIDFKDLNRKWENELQVYNPGNSELKKATLCSAIEEIEAAGKILIKAMDDRSTAYTTEKSASSDMAYEAGKFATQSKSFSILQRAVGEAKDAHLMAYSTLNVPKPEEIVACSRTFELLDSSITVQFSEGIKKIEMLERRVEKLTTAEKELNALIPKIEEAWSKYIGQFELKVSDGFLSFLSFSSKPKSEHLIYKNNPNFIEVSKLTCKLQRKLMQTKDESNLGEYLINLSGKLLKLGNDLKTPEQVDEFTTLEVSPPSTESEKMIEDDTETLKSKE